jgi:hypothetical protein
VGCNDCSSKAAGMHAIASLQRCFMREDGQVPTPTEAPPAGSPQEVPSPPVSKPSGAIQ